eukprot:scaffold53143_cov23-Tisochrysis_lutea.AAC.5
MGVAALTSESTSSPPSRTTTTKRANSARSVAFSMARCIRGPAAKPPRAVRTNHSVSRASACAAAARPIRPLAREAAQYTSPVRTPTEARSSERRAASAEAKAWANSRLARRHWKQCMRTVAWSSSRLCRPSSPPPTPAPLPASPPRLR